MKENLSEETQSNTAPLAAPAEVSGERRQDDIEVIASALAGQGRISLRVRGSSMLPWVRPGDIAVVRRTDVAHVRCGDVVLILRDKRLIVHRLVKKDGSSGATKFLAKGDAHSGDDGMIHGPEILGGVMKIYRGNRLIDLDEPRHLALGILISQFSRKSAYWYPLVRLAAVVTQPFRRMWQANRAA